MSILFVTGTSGVGKDFVSDHLEKRFASLRVVSWDEVFNQIKSRHPESAALPNYNWIYNNTNRIDFKSEYREIAFSRGNSQECFSANSRIPARSLVFLSPKSRVDRKRWDSLYESRA